MILNRFIFYLFYGKKLNTRVYLIKLAFNYRNKLKCSKGLINNT